MSTSGLHFNCRNFSRLRRRLLRVLRDEARRRIVALLILRAATVARADAIALFGERKMSRRVAAEAAAHRLAKCERKNYR